MRGDPTCPRCGAHLHAPNVRTSAWVCDAHGPVHPLQPPCSPTAEVVRTVAAQARVPLWLPWPLPNGWLVTGLAHAGDERSGARAVAVACSGPAPLGGPGDLLFVGEEPGVGLGARYAGLRGPDPGAISKRVPPYAKVHAAGHPTPLWEVGGARDRAAFVGEACGNWLWAVLWPETAGLLLQQGMSLIDLRETGRDIDLPLGALTPWL